MADEIEVRPTDYGCVIYDNSVCEAVAVNLEDVPKLIKDLQALIPIDFNEVAYSEPQEFTYGVDYGILVTPDGREFNLNEAIFQDSIEAFRPLERMSFPHCCSCHVNGNPCGVCKALNCTETAAAAKQIREHLGLEEV